MSDHTQEDAQQTQTAHASQPAAGAHPAQSHVPPLTQPDGVQGWRIWDHLGVT